MRLNRLEGKDCVMALGILLIAAIMMLLYRFEVETNHKESPPKIGFVMLGGMTDEGWNKSQYEAIREVTDAMGAQLLVKQYIREGTGACTKAVEELSAEGAGMIFLSSYSYSMEAKNFIGRYPQIAFATNSAEHHAKNMTAYFVRMYQGRFLAGIIAGLKTKTGIVGYVAAMPNSEVNRGINAFTLGVRRVNPKAKVLVTWTNAWQDEEKEMANARLLVNKGNADVLTYHQDEKATADACEEMGIDFIGYHEVLAGYSPHNLTNLVCRWEIYYRDIVQRYLKGEINSVNNHWIGIDDAPGPEQEVVYLSPFSSAITEEMTLEEEDWHQRILGGYRVFEGPLYDNRGNLRVEAGETIGDDALLEHIDWLVQGVEILE